MYYGGAALQAEIVEGLLHAGRRKVDFRPWTMRQMGEFQMET
jgi:hypothetical protein